MNQIARGGNDPTPPEGGQLLVVVCCCFFGNNSRIWSTRVAGLRDLATPWPGMILGFFAAHASASSLPGRTPLRVAVCLVGEPRSAAQTAPSIRRHVLDVLDAEAFMVSHISNGHRGLNESLAIERLLGPRVRRAVHRSAQELQPAGLATRLEQVAEPLLRRATKLAAHSTLSTPLTSSPPAPPPLATRREPPHRTCAATLSTKPL